MPDASSRQLTREILPPATPSRRGLEPESPGGALIVAAAFPRPHPGASSWMEPAAAAARRYGAGTGARWCWVVIGMTQQYVAGELSVLLGHVQAAATTEAAGQDAWSLRQAAETEPIQALGWVTVRALALTERLCWDSLNRGDTAAFTRQAAAGAALREFGICAGLLRDA